MKRLKIVFLPYRLIMVLTALLLSTNGAVASLAKYRDAQLTAQAECGTWSVVPSPNVNTGDSSLGAVAATSANDIWAVGTQVNANSNIAKTLIEHWNGRQWQIVSSPNVEPFGNTLYGVASTSANDAWAVGYAIGKNHVAQTLIEHWNGQSWSIVNSPNPGTAYNLLYAATALTPDNAWAVGYAMEKGHFRTLIEHWNGKNWSVIRSPDPGASNNLLYGVKAVAANDVWAVGQYLNTTGPDQTLIEHWDGSSWSVISHPLTTETSSALFGVTASFENIWTVGSVGGVNAPTQNFVEQRDEDGTKWTSISGPNIGTGDNQLYGVATVKYDRQNNNDAWAVGTYLNTSGNHQTLIEHSDGQHWDVVKSPSPGSGDNILGGVAAVSANDVWAVGSFDSGGNTQTLVEHYGCLKTDAD